MGDSLHSIADAARIGMFQTAESSNLMLEVAACSLVILVAGVKRHEARPERVNASLLGPSARLECRSGVSHSPNSTLYRGGS